MTFSLIQIDHDQVRFLLARINVKLLLLTGEEDIHSRQKVVNTLIGEEGELKQLAKLLGVDV